MVSTTAPGYAFARHRTTKLGESRRPLYAARSLSRKLHTPKSDLHSLTLGLKVRAKNIAGSLIRLLASPNRRERYLESPRALPKNLIKGLAPDELLKYMSIILVGWRR